MDKFCHKCNNFKDLSAFSVDNSRKDGLQTKCKECDSIYHKAFKERRKDYYAQWKKQNNEHLILYRKKYRDKNKDRINAYKKQKRQNDPNFKLMNNMRKRLWKYLKTDRQEGVLDFVGCSIDKLKDHLESQFQPGMTWENQGKWHVDHIIPLSSFDFEIPENKKIAFHYTNLQPLWAIDNYKKGTKV